VRARRVGFLTSLPAGGFFSHYDYPLWYESLVLQLRRRGYELEILHVPPLSGRALDRELAAIVRRFPMEAWLLHRALPAVQEWFSQNTLPAVVIGSRLPDMSLAAYDVDNRAVCRHAANTLFRLGHRRIAFLVSDAGRPGDALSEQGFLEAATKHPNGEALVFRHTEALSSLRVALRQIFQASPEITGLVVAHAMNVPLALITAAQMGRPCPEKLSLIARTDHACLNRLLPEPSRYVLNEQAFAAGVARTLDAVTQQKPPAGLSTHIIPKFQAADSIQRHASDLETGLLAGCFGPASKHTKKGQS
jgi:DNA-binding LacI/PurR family transcriptional regulator